MLILNNTEKFLYTTAATFVFNVFNSKDKHEMQVYVDSNALTSQYYKKINAFFFKYIIKMSLNN